MVVAGTSQPIPAAMAVCLAGFWPAPAWRTCPKITVSMSDAWSPDCSIAFRSATVPSCTAVWLASTPVTLPSGVRAADRMTTSFGRGSGMLLVIAGRLLRRLILSTHCHPQVEAAGQFSTD
ncbi:hypothetical protein ABH923_002350 [Leifsonia sp. EB41]